MIALLFILLAGACTPGAANLPATTQPVSTTAGAEQLPGSPAITAAPQETQAPAITAGPLETTAPAPATETTGPVATAQETQPVIVVTPATPAVSPTTPGTPASLPGTGAACPLTDEEYAVYSAVIREKFLTNREVRLIVLKDMTVGIMAGDIPPVQEDFVRAQKPDQAAELMTDLETKMAQPCAFEQRFAGQIAVRLISQAEQEQIFAQPQLDKAWTNFYVQNPGAQGILEFSRVGFSQDGNTAVVYAGNQQGGLAGGGYNYVLEKRNDQWVVVAEIMTWIS